MTVIKFANDLCDLRRPGTPDRLMGDALPELLQGSQPVVRLVADDDRGVDGADGGADNPIRLDAGVVQRVIDARLERSERTSALQNEHDLPIAGGNTRRLAGAACFLRLRLGEVRHGALP